MQPTDPQASTTLVLWAAFGLSAAFGAIAQRFHSCTMGALADWFAGGSTRMRMWMWVMAITAGARAALRFRAPQIERGV